ncbi:F0F1 ATP synthase subunit gamma [Marinicella gelatinilytica]|uniref:F0F1 ATP synthase subunit gamma n=1 Tax=Marinicella gelatinilytica TaxID=2996017 RepID=UPI00226082B4|nr:F0F1 ATP synthase subunit gamma [Marinicella gelatinilytica]MCX7546144.1 F0F1 ATP synthase subunit gamma [Marinicella gelatinilytica]
MAVGREIVTKIKSVQSTRKVTTALEMVSASKIKKAQEQMEASRPYVGKIKEMINHLAQASPEYKHPFMQDQEADRVGYIIISTDRGLCGGLNANLFKKAVINMRDWETKGKKIDVVTVGNKATSMFKNSSVNLQANISSLGDNPKLTELIGVVKVMLDAFMDGKVSQVYLVYNDFINTMTQQATVEQLLPLPAGEETIARNNWDYLYEPDAKEVLDNLMTRYIESLVYQGVLENLASEHAARMVAMKSATDNASDLIKDLQLVYNKARQAAITQEISEIVSGAAAV